MRNILTAIAIVAGLAGAVAYAQEADTAGSGEGEMMSQPDMTGDMMGQGNTMGQGDMMGQCDMMGQGGTMEQMNQMMGKMS